MRGCVVGLSPIQDPQGCVWLSQNVPIILLSCFSAVIDSYCTDGLLLLPRGGGGPLKQSCSQVEPGGRGDLQSPQLSMLKAASQAEVLSS